MVTTIAALAGLASQLGRGLDAPLLYVDVISGTALLLGLWGRRRWPLALGLASVPVLAVSSFGFIPGMVIMCTVAAYRRWPAAVLVGALQIAVLPIFRNLQVPDPVPDSAHYVICILLYAAVIAWGMFLRARRQSQHAMRWPSGGCSSSRRAPPSAR